MAYLPEDDKQLQQNGQPQTTGTSDSGGAFAGSAAGQVGSTPAGNNVAPSIAGAGGQGAFQNIQSYLAANQNTPNTANALRNQVGGAFQQDKNNILTQANQAKTDISSAKNANTFSQDAASNLIQQGNDEAKTTLQGYMHPTYSAPTSFSYGLSNDTQQYGQALSDPAAYNGLLQNVYSKAAGGQFGAGQYSLQKQLDQDNPYNIQATADLKNQYSELNPLLQNETQAVSDQATAAQSSQGQAADQWTQYMNSLKEGLETNLTNSANSAKSRESSNIADAISHLKGNNFNPLAYGQADADRAQQALSAYAQSAIDRGDVKDDASQFVSRQSTDPTYFNKYIKDVAASGAKTPDQDRFDFISNVLGGAPSSPQTYQTDWSGLASDIATGANSYIDGRFGQGHSGDPFSADEIMKYFSVDPNENPDALLQNKPFGTVR